MSSVSVAKKTEGGDTWEKQVRPRPHRDELWQRIRAHGGAILSRNGHATRCVRRTRAAGQRIHVVVQSAKSRVVAPRLLDELELTLQLRSGED